MEISSPTPYPPITASNVTIVGPGPSEVRLYPTLVLQGANEKLQDLFIQSVDIDGVKATQNLIVGNLIASISLTNGTTANTIGGSTVGTANTFSGSGGGPGITIDGVGTIDNLVEGNFIGNGQAGSFAPSAILISDGASENTIGGTTADARNIISGWLRGISIAGSNTTHNLVAGNFIGPDAAGTHKLGNGAGLEISAPDNTVGGTTAGARNVISGCGLGILISGSSAGGNLVVGNFIGPDATGTTAMGDDTGIVVSAPYNTIGGIAAGARNVISGCELWGIAISNSVLPWDSSFSDSVASGNLLVGNFIGTDATGSTAMGNDTGVGVDAPNNTIGGTTAGARNIISANRVGISLGGSGNIVSNNIVGTDVSGTDDIGNKTGVMIGASDNTIGGTISAEGNIIANCSDWRVYIVSGVRNEVLGNSF
jgi:titin